jgi:hypothetical protein
MFRSTPACLKRLASKSEFDQPATHRSGPRELRLAEPSITVGLLPRRRQRVHSQVVARQLWRALEVFPLRLVSVRLRTIWSAFPKQKVTFHL